MYVPVTYMMCVYILPYWLYLVWFIVKCGTFGLVNDCNYSKNDHLKYRMWFDISNGFLIPRNLDCKIKRKSVYGIWKLVEKLYVLHNLFTLSICILETGIFVEMRMRITRYVSNHQFFFLWEERNVEIIQSIWQYVH